MVRLWLKAEVFDHGGVVSGRRLAYSQIRSVVDALGSGGTFVRTQWLSAADRVLQWPAPTADALFDAFRCFAVPAPPESLATEHRFACSDLAQFLLVQMFTRPSTAPSPRERAGEISEIKSPGQTSLGVLGGGSGSPQHGAVGSPQHGGLGSPQHGGSPMRSPRSPRVGGAALKRAGNAAAHRLSFMKRLLPDLLRLVQPKLGASLSGGVSRREVDALSFLLAGGPDLTRAAARLSDLVPWWADVGAGAAADAASGGAVPPVVPGSGRDEDDPVSAVFLLEWLTQTLTVNGRRYPPYPPPGISLGRGGGEFWSQDGEDRPTSAMKESKVGSQPPHPPNAAAGAAAGPGRQPQAVLELPLIVGGQHEEASRDSHIFRAADLDGPGGDVFVGPCDKAKVYVVAPVRFALVRGCTNCTVYVGAVAKCITVECCERTKIITCCGRLAVSNCVDCEFDVYTPTRPLLEGDNRGLTIAPYASSYPMLVPHLHLAGIRVRPHAPNQWDKWLALRGPRVGRGGSGSGGVDSGVCAALAPEKLVQFVVPVEMDGPSDGCPFPLPKAYAAALREQQARLVAIQSVIDNADLTEQQRGELTSAILSKFQEWLVNTRQARQLLDLLRIQRTAIAAADGAGAAQSGEGKSA